MKKILFILVILLCSFTIVNAIRHISLLLGKQQVLTRARADLQKAQEENQKLKKQLSYVQTNTFIEEEARNKLFLVRPGENNVVIDSHLLASNSAIIHVQTQKSNLQQWIELFFE